MGWGGGGGVWQPCIIHDTIVLVTIKDVISYQSFETNTINPKWCLVEDGGVLARAFAGLAEMRAVPGLEMILRAKTKQTRHTACVATDANNLLAFETLVYEL